MADPSLADALSGPLHDAVRTALGDFADENPRRLEEVLADLGVDVRALWDLPRWNAEIERAPERRPARAEVDATAAAAVDAALDQVADVPAGAALLGLHLWGLCCDAWEHTYRFHRLTSPLRAFAAAWTARRERTEERSRAAGDAVAELAASMIVETEVESALCRGDLARQAAKAGEAIACGERLARSGGHVDDAFDPLGPLLVDLGEDLAAYYRALRTAVESASAALAGGPGPADAIASLREAEEHFAEDRVYRSELRAHRRNLERIAAAADREWLTVDDARIVYLYPFGLNGIDPTAAVRSVRENGVRSIAGIRSGAVRRSFELDDVWAGSDYLNRRFGGTAIELPPVVLTHEDGGEIAELKAEVRLSDLGNHYLRLEADLSGCGPHELHFALFRAASEHAAVAVSCGGEARWERLADFARDVQRGVADLLSGSVEDVRQGVADRPAEAGGPVKALSGRYRVLLSIFDASAGRGPGASEEDRRPVESGTELLRLFGAQAVLPAVPNGISSVCGWAGAAVDRGSLLKNVGDKGDLVSSTVNSTVTALLGSPSFIIGMFETVAEFVGSLDGLFSAWHDRLAEHHETIKGLIAKHTDDSHPDALGLNAKELRKEQLALHNFAAEARSVLSLIHSPNLMTSPKDAETLLRLLRAAEVDRQELDFAAKLRELLSDRVEVHINDLVASAEAERNEQERTHQGRVQALLAAVTAFGLAGGVQVLQGGSVGNDPVAWGAVAGIAALAAVLSIAVYRWSTRRRRPRSESRRGTGRHRRPEPPDSRHRPSAGDPGARMSR